MWWSAKEAGKMKVGKGIESIRVGVGLKYLLEWPGVFYWGGDIWVKKWEIDLVVNQVHPELGVSPWSSPHGQVAGLTVQLQLQRPNPLGEGQVWKEGDQVNREDTQKVATAESLCDVLPKENWLPPRSNLVTGVCISFAFAWLS